MIRLSIPTQSVIIHAPNVHQGGGKTLLTALLESLPAETIGHLLLDARMDLPASLPRHMQVWRFAPTLRDRLAAEWQLRKRTRQDSHVLCFGNLPPLFRIKGRVSVFVQNWHLMGRTTCGGFSLAKQWQHRIEHNWFRSCGRHADEFIVQTETMRRQLHSLLEGACPVRILPFVPQQLLAPLTSRDPCELRYDFCYVASAEPHKNHSVLLEAWRRLAAAGQFPSLALTVSPDRFQDLSRRLASSGTNKALRITNLGHVPHDRICDVYRQSRWLVYPSLCESFGLPLIEAQHHGLRILAPELDYVRDVVEPDETFDPTSSRSLARAVLRALGSPDPRRTIVDAGRFLDGWLDNGLQSHHGQCRQVLHSR